MSKKLPAIHPGEVLREEFLQPLGLSSTALAKALGVTPARINEIVREKRGITAETLFYALAIVLAIIGEGEGTNLYFAWAYVVLRIIHSLVQALSNKIEVRFLLFVLSNVPLLVLTYSGARALIA